MAVIWDDEQKAPSVDATLTVGAAPKAAPTAGGGVVWDQQTRRC